ncbi:hypothetical protein BsWGS_16244 [Bradybaena similaris]
MNILLIISSRHVRYDIVKYDTRIDSPASENVYDYQNAGTNIPGMLQVESVDSSNASSVRQLLHDPAKETEKPAVACNFCPFDPPDLLGPLADLSEDINETTLAVIFPEVKSARVQPTDCVARQRIAIIIPYRKRYPHLHILLHNLIPFLIRQQADATFFVIEQAMPETFNRGALLNVGFLEAEKNAKFDCYIFHDVDLIPLDDRHMYRCGDNPKHFAVAMNKNKFRLPYPGYFGGVVGFTRRQYIDINGCSNVYFGWGGEDDDLNVRAFNKGYMINRAPVAIARYDMIKHTRDKGNEVNPVRKRILSSARQRQDLDGLNTISYKVNSVRHERFYVWINVSLNRTIILQNSPKYVLDAILSGGANEKPVTKPVGTFKAHVRTPQQTESVQEVNNMTTFETAREQTTIESLVKS